MLNLPERVTNRSRVCCFQIRNNNNMFWFINAFSVIITECMVLWFCHLDRMFVYLRTSFQTEINRKGYA